MYSIKLDLQKTQKENALLNNVDRQVIRRYCKKHQITLKNGRGKQPNVTKNPFDLTNIENHYWLGYFIGDGGFSRTSISIFSKDFEIVEAFKLHCNNDCPIQSRDYYVKSDKRTMYKSEFSSKEITMYLNQLGIPNNKKTFNMQINFDLTWEIVRGLFDADGSLSKGEFKITSSNYDLVKKLETFFNDHSFRTRISTKGNSFDINVKWCLIKQFDSLGRKKLLYNLLYPNEESMCLSRKKEQFSRLIE